MEFLRTVVQMVDKDRIVLFRLGLLHLRQGLARLAVFHPIAVLMEVKDQTA